MAQSDRFQLWHNDMIILMAQLIGFFSYQQPMSLLLKFQIPSCACCSSCNSLEKTHLLPQLHLYGSATGWFHVCYICGLFHMLYVTRVGYRSHLNWYGTGIGTWNSVPVPNGTFFQYFTLCNNKNIYFSEKISPKLSISTFWTIGPYNSFSSRNSCVLFFLIIKWRHETFISFLSNENETLLFFGNKQRFTVQINTW